MERGGAAVACTDEQLQREMLCHRQWTDEYVEHLETLMRQNVVVIWLLIAYSPVAGPHIFNKPCMVS